MLFAGDGDGTDVFDAGANPVDERDHHAARGDDRLAVDEVVGADDGLVHARALADILDLRSRLRSKPPNNQ